MRAAGVSRDDSSLRALGGTGAFTQIGGTYPSFMIRVDGVVNTPPAFRVDTIGRRFNENGGASEPATATAVGNPIEATDAPRRHAHLYAQRDGCGEVRYRRDDRATPNEGRGRNTTGKQSKPTR